MVEKRGEYRLWVGDLGKRDHLKDLGAVRIIIFINCKWVDTHSVAVVISHITYARTVKVDYFRFRWEGLHGKHVVYGI
jgi:hypothetical protein